MSYQFLSVERRGAVEYVTLNRPDVRNAFNEPFTLGAHTNMPLLIAPMGASAVLLFAVPASPLAQPWSAVGGNTIGAILGVLSARFIPDPMVAAGVAVSLTIGATALCRCLHPPAGAVFSRPALDTWGVVETKAGFETYPLDRVLDIVPRGETFAREPGKRLADYRKWQISDLGTV